jgi:hypothetical protein
MTSQKTKTDLTETSAFNTWTEGSKEEKPYYILNCLNQIIHRSDCAGSQSFHVTPMPLGIKKMFCVRACVHNQLHPPVRSTRPIRPSFWPSPPRIEMLSIHPVRGIIVHQIQTKRVAQDICKRRSNKSPYPSVSPTAPVASPVDPTKAHTVSLSTPTTPAHPSSLGLR